VSWASTATTIAAVPPCSCTCGSSTAKARLIRPLRKRTSHWSRVRTKPSGPTPTKSSARSLSSRPASLRASAAAQRCTRSRASGGFPAAVTSITLLRFRLGKPADLGGPGGVVEAGARGDYPGGVLADRHAQGAAFIGDRVGDPARGLLCGQVHLACLMVLVGVLLCPVQVCVRGREVALLDARVVHQHIDTAGRL